MKIEKLILEILEHGISISGVHLIITKNKKKVIGYLINGFSKSGTITLYEDNSVILAQSRYEQSTQISQFDDLISLAWKWYTDYKDRSPFENPDVDWLPYFIEKGWIKETTKTVYEIVFKQKS